MLQEVRGKERPLCFQGVLFHTEPFVDLFFFLAWFLLLAESSRLVPSVATGSTPFLDHDSLIRGRCESRNDSEKPKLQVLYSGNLK